MKQLAIHTTTGPLEAGHVYEEVIKFCWIDEDGARVSPVHADFGAALSWIIKWPETVANMNKRWGWNWKLHEDQMARITLTGKPPARLRRVVVRTMIELVERHEAETVTAVINNLDLTLPQDPDAPRVEGVV